MRNTLLFRKPWLLSTILLLPALAFAQVTEEWVARYNGPGNGIDASGAVAVDENGNVYVTGSSVGSGTGSDYTTIKYNAAGVQQWVAIYNGPGNGSDGANAVALDKDGNVYVTGSSTGIGTGEDYATIKYNAAGVQQWEARYNGPGNGTDAARSLAVDAVGNVYVTGSGIGIGTGFDYTTIKYNAAGVQQWVARYNGPGNDFDAATSLAVDAFGNVYITGSSTGIGTSEDYTTIRYNATGVQQWEARYNGPANSADRARSLAIDTESNTYITGGSFSNETGWDYATVMYDENGNANWVKRFNGDGNFDDDAMAISVDANGFVYVTGMSNMEPFFDPGDPSSAEFGTIKYDANGNQLWLATYNGPEKGFDRANDLAVDASGNVYVTGVSRTGDEDFAIVKYNANGIQQWEARYNGPGDFNDAANSLAIDAQGNVYVTGYSTGIGTGFDYATIKYSQLSIACGNKGEKVLICHKGKKTLCISVADTADHISHGDQLGECIVNGARVAADESEPLLPVNALTDRLRTFNAPNPVSTTTKIYFELPAEGHVTIKVFDMLGKEITTLVDAFKKTGTHSSELDASVLQKGFYFYRVVLKTKDKQWMQTGKISVVK